MWVAEVLVPNRHHITSQQIVCSPICKLIMLEGIRPHDGCRIPRAKRCQAINKQFDWLRWDYKITRIILRSIRIALHPLNILKGSMCPLFYLSYVRVLFTRLLRITSRLPAEVRSLNNVVSQALKLSDNNKISYAVGCLLVSLILSLLIDIIMFFFVLCILFFS